MSAGHRVPARSTGGTIRRRVARILALPAAVVLVLLTVVAAGQVQDLRASRSVADSVTLTLGVQDLVHELQTERGLTAGVLGGNKGFLNELAPARARVDRQRASLARLVRGGGAAETAVRSALQQLDGLPAVRSATDTGAAGRAAAFRFFTDRIGALVGADVGLDGATDGRLRRGAAALQSLGEATEALAQERAFLNGVFSAGGFGKGEYVTFASMEAAKQVALRRFERFAGPTEKASLQYLFGTGAAQTQAHFLDVANAAADGSHLVLNPQTWWSSLTTVLDDLQQLQQHSGSLVQLRAHELEQQATQRIAGLLAIVLLCLVGSAYLAVVASRSITRPLAALAAEAESVAAERLSQAVQRVQGGRGDAVPVPPAPVRVPDRATTEIRSVASALDHLQSAAFGLATEQAMQRRSTVDALANLGRRNQNLIQRQLGFITSLEREEMDPAGLANLFELDHLATRMRRNAASLLVLVGANTPRQWNTGVPVADVVRAAVSEVEEYRRVALRRVDDVLVTGTAVGAVAHLLSELIENGLMFSPPDTEVEVQGRRLPDGYLVAITDQGIGMSADELAEANSRLRGEGDFIAAPTRFLGHFVVGTLAAQTGVKVELLPSPVSGVTARVTLPAALLTTPLSVEGGTVHATVTVDSVASPRQHPAAQRLANGQQPRTIDLTAPPAPLPVTTPPPAAAAGFDGTPSGRPAAPRPAVGTPSPVEEGPTGAPAGPAGRPNDRPAQPLQPAAVKGSPNAPQPPSFAPSRPAVTPAGSPAVTSSASPAANGPVTEPIAVIGPVGATPPPVPAAVASGTGSTPPDRTRNGLRKRLPRDQRPATAPTNRVSASAAAWAPPTTPTGSMPYAAPVRAGLADRTVDDGSRVIDLDALTEHRPPEPAGPWMKPAVDDSPAELGARLSALRDGMRRGRTPSPTEGEGSR